MTNFIDRAKQTAGEMIDDINDVGVKYRLKLEKGVPQINKMLNGAVNGFKNTKPIQRQLSPMGTYSQRMASTSSNGVSPLANKAYGGLREAFLSGVGAEATVAANMVRNGYQLSKSAPAALGYGVVAASVPTLVATNVLTNRGYDPLVHAISLGIDGTRNAYEASVPIAKSWADSRVEENKEEAQRELDYLNWK